MWWVHGHLIQKLLSSLQYSGETCGKKLDFVTKTVLCWANTFSKRVMDLHGAEQRTWTLTGMFCPMLFLKDVNYLPTTRKAE